MLEAEQTAAEPEPSPTQPAASAAKASEPKADDASEPTEVRSLQLPGA